MKYLGLPLVPSKLTFKYRQPLLIKIQLKKKFKVAAKKLSYGGRIQLILAVLSGVYMYWTSVFMLPKAINRKVDSMMCSFLWTGDLKSCYGVKVKWSDVCKPKE